MARATDNNNEYALWCEMHDVSHGHCPLECDHPQPFWHPTYGLICGHCAIIDHLISIMIPCNC
jgi:hypothetical protein